MPAFQPHDGAERPPSAVRGRDGVPVAAAAIVVIGRRCGWCGRAAATVAPMSVRCRPTITHIYERVVSL